MFTSSNNYISFGAATEYMQKVILDFQRRMHAVDEPSRYTPGGHSLIHLGTETERLREYLLPAHTSL